jgi:hypothetical protein
LRHTAQGELQADLTIMGEVDIHPLVSEYLLHQAGKPPIVFDH